MRRIYTCWILGLFSLAGCAKLQNPWRYWRAGGQEGCEGGLRYLSNGTEFENVRKVSRGTCWEGASTGKTAKSR